MKKYNVHFGCRLTYDLEVEAENEDEAVAKAEAIFNIMDYEHMDYADTDYDVWEV